MTIPTNAVNFRLEGIETLTPDARRTEAREERFERGERRAVERILTLAAADGVTHEAGLAEHAEMSAGSWPAHVEGVRDRSGIPRALVQHDEDLTSDRIGEGLGDGVHGAICNQLVTHLQAKTSVQDLSRRRALDIAVARLRLRRLTQ